MKYTLKSLLTTTVLTVPSVFGAAAQDDGLFGTQQATQSSLSIVDVVSRVYEQKKAGNHEAAARVYAEYGMQPDAIWFNIRFSTQEIEELGYLDMAAAVFEWSKTHPKTQCFKDVADAEILRLLRLRQASESHAKQQATQAKELTPAGIESAAPVASSAVPVVVPEAVVAPGVVVNAANKIRYEAMYAELKEVWKAVAGRNLHALFFDGGVEGSELTYTAILELMYGFLIEHPEINIPDLQNFGSFTIANYDETTHVATISQMQQLKNKLLNQALAAFAKGQKLFATVVQIGGAGSGHFTVVVIECDGKVHMINTMGNFPGLKREDPYVHIMPVLVNALNSHKGAVPIEFTAGSNVRTGIQDADALSNSCGIYSFVYWAALMMTQDINSYKRVTAAAADGYLAGYEDIIKAATHSRAIDRIAQVVGGADEYGIQYLKNPSAEVQARFERDVRDRLQLKLTEFAP
jgi:hypothetical protein